MALKVLWKICLLVILISSMVCVLKQSWFLIFCIKWAAFSASSFHVLINVAQPLLRKMKKILIIITKWCGWGVGGGRVTICLEKFHHPFQFTRFCFYSPSLLFNDLIFYKNKASFDNNMDKKVTSFWEKNSNNLDELFR